MSNDENSRLRSRYERYSNWGDRFALLILVGLSVEIIAVFVLQRPFLEGIFTISSTALILIGVWGELRFAKYAKEAGDGIVAEAEARASEANKKAAEAQLELAKYRTTRRAILRPHMQSLAKKLRPFSGTVFDTGTGTSDGEQADCLWDLEEVLIAAGWRQTAWITPLVGAQVIQRARRPVSGQVAAQNVEIHLDSASKAALQPATDTFISALNEIGIEATEAAFNVNNANTDAMHVLVGPKR